MSGDEDVLTPLENARLFFSHIKCKDKQLKVFPKERHELFHDYKKD